MQRQTISNLIFSRNKFNVIWQPSTFDVIDRMWQTDSFSPEMWTCGTTICWDASHIPIDKDGDSISSRHSNETIWRQSRSSPFTLLTDGFGKSSKTMEQIENGALNAQLMFNTTCTSHTRTLCKQNTTKRIDESWECTTTKQMKRKKNETKYFLYSEEKKCHKREQSRAEQEKEIVLNQMCV